MADYKTPVEATATRWSDEQLYRYLEERNDSGDFRGRAGAALRQEFLEMRAKRNGGANG